MRNCSATLATTANFVSSGQSTRISGVEISFGKPASCAESGFPDFATIRIRYIPDEKLVELKSLKLYINKFRDQEVFHEAAVNRILDDLVTLLDPRFMEVVGDFNVRGNIKTVIRAHHREETWTGQVDPWWTTGLTGPPES